MPRRGFPENATLVLRSLSDRDFAHFSCVYFITEKMPRLLLGYQIIVEIGCSRFASKFLFNEDLFICMLYLRFNYSNRKSKFLLRFQVTRFTPYYPYLMTSYDLMQKKVCKFALDFLKRS